MSEKLIEKGDRVRVGSDHPHPFMPDKEGTVIHADKLNGSVKVEWDEKRSVINGFPQEEEYVERHWLNKIEGEYNEKS